MKPISFWKAVFSVLGLAATILFVSHVWAILIPFLMGLVAAYLVQPLVDRFVGMGLRRDRTVLVLYLGLLSIVGFLGFLLVPSLISELNSALEQIPFYTEKLNALNDLVNSELNRWLGRVLGHKAAHISLPFHVDRLAEKFVSQIPENMSVVAHTGMWIIIIPFVCYFALAQGKNWVNALFNGTPSEYVEQLLGLIAEINATLGGYIRGQLLDGMCVGLMTMAGLWLLGFEQAVLMGVFCGFLNPVPFLAPIVGGTLTLLVAYFQGMGVSSLIGIISLFLLIRLCDDFIFTPFIVGQSVHLHPVIMLFAILAGVEVGGFMGLIFAIPAAAILKVVLATLLTHRRQSLAVGNQQIIS